MTLPINDVGEIREQLAPPEERKYTLMAKKDGVYIVPDRDRPTTIFRPAAADLLQERGYTFDGVNYDNGTLVFRAPDDN